MKNPIIIFLDCKPLIVNNLSLDAFRQLGQVTLYDSTSAEELMDRAKNAEILVTNKVKISAQHIAALPKLKYIGVTATGVDNIDVKAANKAGITVTNVPDYSTDSVVQHVLALLLNYSNHVDSLNQSVQRQEWTNSAYFSYWLEPLIELKDQTLGILGFGKVAKKLAQVARSLGMNVIAHKPTAFVDEQVLFVSFEELLASSDFLSLHCPLTAETEKIINDQTLAVMKPGCVLINTSRGGLIDETALAEALQQGKLAAAFLDVLSKEPPEAKNPLIGLANCIITPHVAWASIAARKRLLNVVTENIIRFLDQKPINIIR